MSQWHRRAISGYVFRWNGGVISWSSKKQELVVLSTTKAEYVGQAHAAKEVLWLRTIVHELLGGKPSTTTIYTDNQGAIKLTKGHQLHSRTKHIDIRFHFIRWLVDDKKICLEYCPTADMLADIMTKALPSLKVKHFARQLGLIDRSSV